MSLTADTVYNVTAEAEHRIANAVSEILSDTRTILAEATDEDDLDLDKVVEWIDHSGSVDDIAEAFASPIADRLAYVDPETLREALRDHDALSTFDRDDVIRYLEDLSDYAVSVRNVQHERLEDVVSELDSISSDIENIVRALSEALDI